MATKANIVIDQGTDFSTEIFITDNDGEVVTLTGYTGAAKMRKHYTSTNSASFTVSINEDLGKVTLTMARTDTANLTPGRYVYDLELTDTVSNVVSRAVEGVVTVTPEVTR